jgi:N-acylneuraminate cytidylyltransferase
MNDESTVALIPLRGGSKSIPDKNIKPIAGKPLCAWVVEAAVSASKIDRVYVSTDSPKIANVVDRLGADVEVVWRPEELATDHASTESVMLHFMESVNFTTLVTVQATSPLLAATDIDKALGEFHAKNLDSMLTAVRTKRFYWHDDGTPINYDPAHRPRRQDFTGTLMENGAFYITDRAVLQAHKCRLGGRIGIFEMREETAVEIDESDDWPRVERLLLDRQGNDHE